MTQGRRQITMVLPVKATGSAKSRLDLPHAQRRDIALWMATKTLSAAAGSDRLTLMVVVTSDSEVRAHASTLGAHVVPDPGDGLNPACERGVAVARDLTPEATIVVMVCDLPEINSGAVDALLSRVELAGDSPVHVSDLSGRGTTAVTLPSHFDGTMVFGWESARRFRAAGWTSLPDVDRRLRADLDTLEDWRALPLEVLRPGDGPSPGASTRSASAVCRR